MLSTRIFLFAVVLFLGCGPIANSLAPRARGRVTFEVENRNWQGARVYLASPAGGSATRITTVTSINTETVTRPVPYPTFFFTVTLLGGGRVNAWIGNEEWLRDTHGCLHLVIMNNIKMSYAYPCRGGY